MFSFQLSITKIGIWIRYGRELKGYNLLFPNQKPLFSERNEIIKPRIKFFNFRLFKLGSIYEIPT